MTRGRQTKKHKGGKYTDEGGYGCGFNPEIRCVGQTERKPGIFSKLMYTKSAIEEYAIKSVLEKIDPTQQYLLYPQTMCKVDVAQLDPVEDNIEMCGVFHSQSATGKLLNTIQQKTSLLKYKNGGVNLNSIRLKPEEFIPFFRDLVQLLEGLVLMHANGFYHLDIKTGNVVHTKTSKRTYSFHYIDFGLSTLGSTPIPERSTYDANYYAWPFEMRFVHPSFDTSGITHGQLSEYYSQGVALHGSDRFPTEVFVDRNGTTIASPIYYKQMYEYMINNDLQQTILEKTDIYSLGRLLSELYSRQFGHKMHYGVIYAAKPDDVRIWTSINKLGLKLPTETMQWHTDVARDLSMPFFNLIKGMMELNPLIRLSADASLTAYKQLVPMFEKYCTTAQISKHLSYYTPHLVILEPPTPPPTPSNSTQMPLDVTNLFALSPKPSPSNSTQMPLGVTNLFTDERRLSRRAAPWYPAAGRLKRGKGSRNLLAIAKNASTRRANRGQ